MLMQNINKIILYALLIEYESGRRYCSVHTTLQDAIDVIKLYVLNQNTALEISGIEPYLKFDKTVADIKFHFNKLYVDDFEFYYKFEDSTAVSIFPLEIDFSELTFNEPHNKLSAENTELKRLLSITLETACPNFDCDNKCLYSKYCDSKYGGDIDTDYTNEPDFDKPFEITSVARADVSNVFNCEIAESLTDDEMKEISCKLADDYCNQLFWQSLKIITESVIEQRNNISDNDCNKFASAAKKNITSEAIV